MMRRLLILLLICCTLNVPNTFANGNTLEIKVTKALAQEQLVGASWALIEGDHTHFGAAGFSNKLQQVPLTTSHKVHVGSITKTVIATGVLALVSAGKLELDTKVSELLPSVNLVNPWQDSHPMTVAHLLDHTAGIQDARFWHLVNTQAQVDSPLDFVFKKDPDLLEVKVKPGSQFAYSNSGYNILAMIIEAVTGVRYEQALYDYVLEPLGMFDSTLTFTSQQGMFFDEQLTYGHLDHGQLFAAVPSYLRAAGQFTTTVADMAKFMRFLMSNGVLNDRVIVDANLLRQMGEPSLVRSYQAGLYAGGGKGLWHRDRNQTLGLCHGGNTAGFKGMLCFYPDQGKAFFVMVNTDSETADYERLNQLMVSELKILSPKPVKYQPYDASDWYGWYAPTIFRFGNFTYLDKLFGILVLKPQNEHVVLSNIQSKNVVLQSVGEGLYVAQGRVSPSHILLRDEDGSPMLSNGFSTFKQINKTSTIALAVSLVLGLFGAAYIFIYGGYVFVTRFNNVVNEPIAITFTMYLAFVLPLPFFATQSFIHIGDVNTASVLLAIASVIAPVMCLLACIQYIRIAHNSKWNLLAITAFLQWQLVLMYWGFIPLRLWDL